MPQILVIDDDEYICDNIAEILEYEGYVTLKSKNGFVGVQTALQIQPDLIICDMMMPEIDGISVLLELRGQPRTCNIPFIFLTANADRKVVRQGMNSGADDYLIKPYTNAELLTAVTARLEKWSATDRLYKQTFDELRVNLINMLPHELRTPLVGILGYGDLMRLEYQNLNGNDIRQMGEVISTEGRRLQHLIENYFLYAQIELARFDKASRDEFVMGQVEKPSVFITDLSRARAKKSDRNRDLLIEITDAAIYISPQSFCKIIEELVDNAFKFSKPGTPVEISASQKGHAYVMDIRDYGHGMTLEQIRRVGVYMQFDRKLYEQQGVGMGLIVAKRLVELCDGRLTMVSEPERGTTITVELPLAT